MSEYTDFISQYSHIDFDGNAFPNKRQLFLLECAAIHYPNYRLGHLKQYDKIYTWNGKLYKDFCNMGMNVVKVPNFPFFDNNFSLQTFKTFEEKIDGICLICRSRDKSYLDFDISYKRNEVFNEINGMIKHCFGKVPYCGSDYKGVIGTLNTNETYPSSLAKLQKLNEYKFNLCFENCYHKDWSWDYITEKITDCFKAKTIPIYWGCYNIEERIPKELYVDFRDFKNTNEMSSFLKTINKSKYIEMTENAFEWEIENKLGSIEELKTFLK